MFPKWFERYFKETDQGKKGCLMYADNVVPFLT